MKRMIRTLIWVFVIVLDGLALLRDYGAGVHAWCIESAGHFFGRCDSKYKLFSSLSVIFDAIPYPWQRNSFVLVGQSAWFCR